MSLITASCTACTADVTLPHSAYVLWVRHPSHDGQYSFTCPYCTCRVTKPADDHIVCLLISGGVVALPWDIPSEALEVHDGPPINEDDLFELHRALYDQDGA